MFASCRLLKTITVGDKFNTRYVKDFSYMFSTASVLESFDFDKLNLSSATNLEGMFENTKLAIDLAGKNMSNVETVQKMFKGYKGTTIDMTDCSLINSVNNLDFIKDCSYLENLIPPININSSITVQANKLPAEAYVALINNLLEVEELQVLSVGSTNILKIPEDSISIAVNKNWSIA
jgi:hypothetical protein